MLVKVALLCSVVMMTRGGVIRYGAPAPVFPGGPAVRFGAPAFAAPGPVLAAAPAVQFGATAFAAPAIKVAATPAYAAQAFKVAAPIYEAPQPYDFGYNLQTDDGGSAHRQEVGDAHNNKQGSYGYTGPDGVYRQVDYVADAGGFRATIRTNEPGTANQNPADIGIAAEPSPVIHSAPVIKAIRPTALYGSPVIHAAPTAFRAPVVHAAPLIKSHTFPY